MADFELSASLLGRLFTGTTRLLLGCTILPKVFSTGLGVELGICEFVVKFIFNFLIGVERC